MVKVRRSVTRGCVAVAKASEKALGGRQMNPALMQSEQTSQCCTKPLQKGGQMVVLCWSRCSEKFQVLCIPGFVCDDTVVGEGAGMWLYRGGVFALLITLLIGSSCWYNPGSCHMPEFAISGDDFI